MAEKKYLDWLGLVEYDGKIKAHVKAGDDATLAAAKGYADGLAVNYDAAGSAATAKSEAVSYVDGKVTELNTTISGVKTIAEQGVSDAATAQAAAEAAQTAADGAQADVDALETYVGTIPSTATATDIVGYVQEKTAGIATDTALEELTGRVAQAESDIDAIQADYLVAADKEELAGDIADAQAAADAVQAEMDAFKLAADVQEGAIDTLKEIQDYITSDGEAAKLMVADIDANKAAIEAEVARATKAEGDIETAYKAADEAMDERIADLEAMFGEGDDTVAAQIEAAVAAEAALRVAGDEAAEASAAAALKAAQDAQGEVDTLEGVVDTLTGVVNGKVSQGDHDTLAGRVTANEQAIAGIDNHSHTNKSVIDGITAELVSGWNDAVSKSHEHANKEVLDGISAALVANWNAAEANANAYTDGKIAEFVAITTGEVDGLFA